MSSKQDPYFARVKMYLDTIEICGNLLTEIVNKSLLTGTFPKCWKKSLVIPIPKVKNTNKVDEFRPVNMLPLESKVIEKIVYIQLRRYLNSFNLISLYQSGFQKNHNCESLINLKITKFF